MDDVDRQVLEGLQRNPRVPAAQLASVLGLSDQTVLRRYRRMQDELRLRVVAVSCDDAEAPPAWIVRIRCVPEAAAGLSRMLAERDDTMYVSVASGGTEVVSAVQPSSGDHGLNLGDLLALPRGVSVGAYCVLHSFFGGPAGWLTKIDALTADQRAQLPIREPAGGERVRRDTADEAWFDLLRQDGRASFRHIAARSRMSEATITRRVERALDGGDIFFDVQFDPKALGYSILAMLWLNVAPGALHSAGRAIAHHPEISFAASTTGPTNLVAYGLFRSTAELYDYLNIRLGSLDGVRNVESVLLTDQVKQVSS